MIKRLTAFNFILIANIFLLVHVVTPHHHHQSVVCFEEKHCQTDAVKHNHNNQEHGHQHEGNTNSTICILNQPVVVPESQNKLFKSCNSYSYNHYLDYYIPSNLGPIYLQPGYNVVIYFSGPPTYITAFAKSTVGLRAPPIV